MGPTGPPCQRLLAHTWLSGLPWSGGMTSMHGQHVPAPLWHSPRVCSWPGGAGPPVNYPWPNCGEPYGLQNPCTRYKSARHQKPRGCRLEAALRTEIGPCPSELPPFPRGGRLTGRSHLGSLRSGRPFRLPHEWCLSAAALTIGLHGQCVRGVWGTGRREQQGHWHREPRAPWSEPPSEALPHGDLIPKCEGTERPRLSFQWRDTQPVQASSGH